MLTRGRGIRRAGLVLAVVLVLALPIGARWVDKEYYADAGIAQIDPARLKGRETRVTGVIQALGTSGPAPWYGDIQVTTDDGRELRLVFNSKSRMTAPGFSRIKSPPSTMPMYFPYSVMGFRIVARTKKARPKYFWVRHVYVVEADISHPPTSGP